MKPIELKDQNEIQLEIMAQATKKTVLWGKKIPPKLHPVRLKLMAVTKYNL